MIPKREAALIELRSGGQCEAIHLSGRCPKPAEVFAHIKHRCMGGRSGVFEKLIHDHRNIAHLCVEDHDYLDKRVYMATAEEWEYLVGKLKEILDWESWYQEYKIAGGK
jgi:hypothetical protein